MENSKMKPHNVIAEVVFLVLMACCVASSRAGEFTALGGVAHFNKPHDGIYWNHNQPHDVRMTTPAFGLRYDTERMWGSYSFGVQYTNFGTVKMDARAVTKDAPEAGGYIQDAGTCVGTCAPLARWKMQTDVQSVAFIGTKHWGRWSLEFGANVFETKTSGYVHEYDNNPAGRFNYSSSRYLGVGPVAGVAYRSGAWSVRAQLWRMEGRAITGDSKSAPAAMNENYQATLMVGYTF